MQRTVSHYRLVFLVFFTFSCVSLAQSARTLGMAGVTLPDRSSATANPAYSAAGIAGPGFELPLPVGALNALTRGDTLIPGSRDENGNPMFDVLPLIDQASHLDTYIFNLPQSPEEITIEVQGADGSPSVALSFEGGSNLAFGLSETRFGLNFALPIDVAAGPVQVGLRPYLFTNGTARPNADLQAFMAGGSSAGGLDVRTQAEAGVALDVIYATRVPSGSDSRVYVGVRGAPYFGLARLDGTGSATVSANLASEAVAGGTVNADYSYQGEAFVSSITQGQFGYGIQTDLGVAADIPVDSGTVSLGLGLTNLGFGIWRGETYTFNDESDSETLDVTPVSSSRTTFSPNFGVTVNGAYSFEASPRLPIMIAADAGYRGGFNAHLGGEASFGVAEGTAVAARAGLGYDSGFRLGLGTGVSTGGISFDLALSSHRAPFTTHQSYGVTASMGF